MKKFFAAMLLAVTIIFVGAQDNKAEAWRYQVVGISTYLSIREEPNANSREIARVPNGTILEPALYYSSISRQWKASYTNGFAGVVYRGMNCWAADRYLEQVDW